MNQNRNQGAEMKSTPWSWTEEKKWTQKSHQQQKKKGGGETL